MKEKDVENYLKEKIKERKGLCYKWRAKDVVGIPDRVCMIPWMGVFFVELKTRNGKLSKIQENVFEKIKDAGGATYVAHGLEGVDKLIEFVDGVKKQYED